MYAIILLLALVHTIRATYDSSCPYWILNATSVSDAYGQARFAEKLDTDFTHSSGSLTWHSSAGADWQAQAYNLTPSAARGPYGKAAETSNVVEAGPNGLQLWVRSQLLSDMVPIAEVATARNDILYGSFRASIRITSVNGTCGAFFFYHNDSQEIDMEFLSRQQSLLNLVLQSPASLAAGDNAAGTPSFVPYTLPFDPAEDFHEYRFDWLPGRVDMNADGNWLHSFYSNTSSQAVPDSPGAIHLIHWSNGDPGWSGGPPAQDAVMEVQWTRAYFNSTNASEDGDGFVYNGTDCQIPALGGPPAQPAGPVNPGTGPTEPVPGTPKHSGGALVHLTARWVLMVVLLIAVRLSA